MESCVIILNCWKIQKKVWGFSSTISACVTLVAWQMASTLSRLMDVNALQPNVTWINFCLPRQLWAGKLGSFLWHREIFFCRSCDAHLKISPVEVHGWSKPRVGTSDFSKKNMSFVRGNDYHDSKMKPYVQFSGASYCFRASNIQVIKL